MSGIRQDIWTNISGRFIDRIRLSGRILSQNPVSCRIAGQISGVRLNIWAAIRYPVGYLSRYPVSGQIYISYTFRYKADIYIYLCESTYLNAGLLHVVETEAAVVCRLPLAVPQFVRVKMNPENISGYVMVIQP